MRPDAQGSNEIRAAGGWCAPSHVDYGYVPTPMVTWLMDLAMTPEDVEWLDQQWSLTE